MKTVTQSDVDRLSEIKDEIKYLVEEARVLVHSTSEDARSKAYWYAHITMALDDDHEFLGSGSHTMQDTIDNLDPKMTKDMAESEE
jgi:hypothetical protein